MTGSFSKPSKGFIEAFSTPSEPEGTTPGNRAPGNRGRASDFEQLLFLGGQHLVDLGAVVVGDPLEVLLLAAEVVFGNLARALQVLHLVLHVAPDVADGDLALLRPLTGHPDQLLAPLLGEGREGEPDDGPVVGGVDPEFRGVDGLLDGGESVAVVW